MKDLLKIVAKKLFIWSIIVNTIYSIADYGESFALSYFGTSPLLLNKLIVLTVLLMLIELIKLITGKIGSYIDNINETKTQTAIEKYYFRKLQSMNMEQISNIHTGYIHKLITNVSRYFFEMTWQFEISVIPLIIGGTSIFIMICKESILTGLICIVISALAVFTKYKMIRNMQKYQKNVNEASSKYNAKFIDFIQNIIAVRKLNIGNFCEDKITENSNEYLKEANVNV
jgi:ABC-type multidrug transport system fused ATPase/permease subunit